MGIGFGAVAGSPKSSIAKRGVESATIWTRKRLLLYPRPSHKSGGRQFIQQGFPKAGGIRLFGDLLTPRPLMISIAVIFIHKRKGDT